MTQNNCSLTLLHLSIYPLILGSLNLSNTAVYAQINPDNTLGAESSVVTPNATVQGQNADLIQGGATRGSNLFHSFQDFNVGELQRVYFANPDGIGNILSRVTGGNLSQILGTLGVDGAANLFLINPNGIIFGENAVIDVRGSFTATSADGILLGENGFFSATNPDGSTLIDVAPSALFFNQIRTFTGAIENSGRLTVANGQNLTLSGDTVINSGTLEAPGGVVALFGNEVNLINNAVIDVSSDTAGGIALIGGDYQGTGTGLISQQTFVGSNVEIKADALQTGDGGKVIVWADDTTHFYGNISARGGDISGDGGFVEVSGKNNLGFHGSVDTSAVNGSFGTLLLDPTNIFVVAAGQDTDDLTDVDDPNDPDLDPANQRTSISNTAINNANADVTLAATNDINFDAPVNIAAPGVGLTADAGRDINVREDITTNGGDIKLDAANNISASNIILNSSTFTDNNAGNIQLTAGGNADDIPAISLDNVTIDSAAFEQGRSGNITIEASNNGIIKLQGAEGETPTTPIFIDAFQSALDNDDTPVPTLRIDGGEIDIENYQIIANSGVNSSTGSIDSSTQDAANIEIEGTSVNISNTLISSTTSAASSPDPITDDITGDAGNISIISNSNNGEINIINSSLTVSSIGESVTDADGNVTIFAGNAGNVGIAAPRIKIENATISSTAEDSQAASGDIGLLATGNDVAIQINNSNIEASSNDSNTGITDNGDFSEIVIAAIEGSIDITENSQVVTANSGSDVAGDIAIAAKGSITINNSILSSDGKFGRVGIGEDFGTLTQLGILTADDEPLIPSTITIQDSRITATNAQLARDTEGNLILDSEGRIELNRDTDGRVIVVPAEQDESDPDNPVSIPADAGNIVIQAQGDVEISDINPEPNTSTLISNATFGAGNAGRITITSTNLSINNANIESNSRASSEELGQMPGDAGSIFLNVDNNLALSGADSQISTSTRDGFGGAIFIAKDTEPASTAIDNSVNLFFDLLEGATVDLEPTTTVEINGGLISASTTGEGLGGLVKIEANDLTIDNGKIESRSDSTGGSGVILLDVENQFQVSGADSRVSVTTKDGFGGAAIIAKDTELAAIAVLEQPDPSDQLALLGAVIITDLDPIANVEINDGEISASTTGEGLAGLVKIETNILEVNNGQITSDSDGSGAAFGIFLDVKEQFTLSGINSQISSTSTESGDSGTILIGKNTEFTDLTVDLEATSIVEIDGGSISTSNQRSGNAGLVKIETNILEVNNGQITSNSTGSGDAGAVFLDVKDKLTLSGADSRISTTTRNGDGGAILIAEDTEPALQAFLDSGGDITAAETVDLEATSNVEINSGEILATTQGSGNAGLIRIETGSLTVGNQNEPNSRIRIESRSESTEVGAGNAGNIILNAEDNISLNNTTVSSQANGTGNSNDITLNSPVVVLQNNTEVTAQTTSGESGTVIFSDIKNLDVINSVVSSSTESGQAQDININSVDTENGSVTLDGQGTFTRDDGTVETRGGIFTEATEEVGRAGSLTITVPTLTLRNNTQLSARNVNDDREGINRNINLTVDNLTVEKSRITASTEFGIAGDINISASESVTLDDQGTFTRDDGRTEKEGGLFARGGETGTPGNIIIGNQNNRSELVIQNGAEIATTAKDTGNNNAGFGSISIIADNVTLNSGGKIDSTSEGNRDAGFISINQGVGAAQKVEVTGTGSSITSEAIRGLGNSNNININARQVVVHGKDATISTTNQSGRDIRGSVRIQGLETNQDDLPNGEFSLEVSGGGSIAASTASGLAGDVVINQNEEAAASANLDKGTIEAQATLTGGQAGTVFLNAKEVTLTDNSVISVENFNDIDIISESNVTLAGVNNLIIKDSRIETSTESGIAGDINITVTESVTLDGSGGLFAGVSERTNQPTGQPGNIKIGEPGNRSELVIKNGAEISTRANNNRGNNQRTGSIVINANNVTLESGAKIDSTTTGTRNAGFVSINQGVKPAQSVILNNSSITSEATEEGNSNNININARQVIVHGENARISTTNESGTDVRGSVTITGLETNENNLPDGEFSLEVSGGGRIAASTGTGRAGEVFITGDNDEAAASVKLDNGIIRAEANDNGGKSGRVFVRAKEVTLSDSSQISATNIDDITSQQSDNPSERSGVTLEQINNLTVEESEIVTSTQSGIAGDINIGATKNVTLNGQGTFMREEGDNTPTKRGGIFAGGRDTGKPGNIIIGNPQNRSELVIRNGAEIAITAKDEGSSANEGVGNININANNITLESGGQIDSTTTGSRDGGNIFIEIVDDETVDNPDKGNLIITGTGEDDTTGIVADARGTGTGGTIVIAKNITDKLRRTITGINERSSLSDINNQINNFSEPIEAIDRVIMRDGATISANTNTDVEGGNLISGERTGGNIFISTLALSQDNDSNISAGIPKGFEGDIEEGLTITAGNILLRLDGDRELEEDDLFSLPEKTVLLTQDSDIRTEGTEGGKIFINARFVLASGNSDVITTNTGGAFNGGQADIDIIDDGFVLGLREREEDTPFNDITGDSVSINSPEIDNQLVPELSQEVVDVSSLIDRRCDISSGENVSSFTIIGDGGLPPNLDKFLSIPDILPDFGTEELEIEAEEDQSQTITPLFSFAKSNLEAEVAAYSKTWKFAQNCFAASVDK